ncbi:MAG: OmpA family protein [Bacteroidota bacterium]|nr:OmpA family protein [Bacteroidota bacterium]
MKIFIIIPLLILMLFPACKSLNNTQKGTGIGVAAGGAAGAIIGGGGKSSVIGALIGAAVGGGAGYLIGNHMDKQAREIKQAVPDAQVERVGEGINMTFNSGLLFKINSSELNDSAKSNLDKIATVFNNYPETIILVEGHTDNTGTVEYNVDLSKKRATVVSDYLISKGVAKERFDIKWYGETQPKYPNDTDANRKLNRRVEVGVMANNDLKKQAESGKLPG